MADMYLKKFEDGFNDEVCEILKRNGKLKEFRKTGQGKGAVEAVARMASLGISDFDAFEFLMKYYARSEDAQASEKTIGRVIRNALGENYSIKQECELLKHKILSLESEISFYKRELSELQSKSEVLYTNNKNLKESLKECQATVKKVDKINSENEIEMIEIIDENNKLKSDNASILRTIKLIGEV